VITRPEPVATDNSECRRASLTPLVLLQKDIYVTFNDLGLIRPILDTLVAQGYETPTPIQTKAIPPILQGQDVVGLAQTGTGKTAAFTLPLLQRLTQSANGGKSRHVRVLVLSPTRELAAQIEKAVFTYGQNLSLKSTCVVGGVPIRRQQNILGRGVDILVATPGRLEDLVSQKSVRLDRVETIVLDEADQMLDIGFMPAIKRILAMLPARRQTLLFSATMPKEIRDLSANHLKDPVEVSVQPVTKTADRIDQTVIHMDHADKVSAINKLVRTHPGKRIIVFTRTKRGADKVAKKLNGEGLGADAIHGNKSQGQRERALAAFRKGSNPVLIATDIAARGIDVPGVEVVVNYDLPNVPESYVHRIGRTARAGASGLAVSFCAGDEVKILRSIERLIKTNIPAMTVDGTKLSVQQPENFEQPSGRRRSPGKRPGGPSKSGGAGAKRRWSKPRARKSASAAR
jgi:ATP-dependent RNA helicase RhlE